MLLSLITIKDSGKKKQHQNRKMLILAVFLAIVAIMIYIYGGLKLAEDLDTPSAYSLFWVAYVLFGLTLGTIIMLGNFWAVLVNKTGPPGARGIPGQQGDSGLPGECDSGNNTYYAMRMVKQGIVDEVLAQQQTQTQSAGAKGTHSTTGTAQSVAPITADMVYDPTSIRLVNIYLDNTVDRMITSKQFEILLDLPTADLNRLPAGKRKTFAKSLEDLSGYLAGTWREWIAGFYTIDKVAANKMVSTADTTPEDEPKLAEYLNQEIEKYDVWYWGTTRVFRPLKAEICRAGTINYGTDPKTGKPIVRANTRFPNKLRAQLEIREIEYSDKDTSKLDETWIISSMPDAIKRFDQWRAKKDGIYGKIPRPRAMIPKIIKDGDKTFYPIGQVFVDTNPNTMTDTKKKTILVSGDVVIPDKLEVTWKDRKGTNILKKGGRGVADGYGVDGRFYQAQTSKPGYKCLGDYYERDKRGDIETAQKYGYFADKPIGEQYDKIKGYTGLVCLPDKCLEEIPRSEEPVFAYQFSRNWYKNNYWQTDNFTAKDAEAGYNIVRGTKSSYKNLRNKKNGPQPGDGKFYRIKPACISPEDIPVKEPEPEFTDLGMGWFGHPYKTDRKYSVFAFLGIMPEGIVIHRQSGQRMYIRHYGGMEPNRFVILNWNGESDEFNRAVRAKSATEVDIVELNLTDERQNWRIAKLGSTGEFQLASIMFPRKVLSLTTKISNKTNFNKNSTNTDLEKLRPPGVSVGQTKILFSLTQSGTTINPQTIFVNLPAYGTDTDILDEPSAKPIDRRKSVREQQSEERKRGGQDDFSYINKGFNKTKTDAADKQAIPGNIVEFTPK